MALGRFRTGSDIEFTVRILASADLHGDSGALQWLVHTAALIKPDAVVLAGDLLDCPIECPTVEQAQLVDAELTYLLKILTQLLEQLLGQVSGLKRLSFLVNYVGFSPFFFK